MSIVGRSKSIPVRWTKGGVDPDSIPTGWQKRCAIVPHDAGADVFTRVAVTASERGWIRATVKADGLQTTPLPRAVYVQPEPAKPKAKGKRKAAKPKRAKAAPKPAAVVTDEGAT